MTSAVMADNIKPRNWQPIDIKIENNVTIYFDRNNHKIVNSDDTKYAMGSILISSNVDKVISVNGKHIVTRSMIKNYIVVCNNGNGLAYSDDFYSSSKPTNITKPIVSIERDSDMGETFSKDSILYKLFCPEYI